jgi:hypothetical protein
LFGKGIRNIILMFNYEVKMFLILLFITLKFVIKEISMHKNYTSECPHFKMSIADSFAYFN